MHKLFSRRSPKETRPSSTSRVLSEGVASAKLDQERGIKYCNDLKYGEAAAEFRKAWGKRTEALGEDHPDTLLSTHWLGYSLYKAEKYNEAEECFREATAAQERTLGPHHSNTLSSRYWLGLAVREQNRYSEAEQYFREAIVGQEQTLGLEHNGTLLGKFSLGLSLCDQGKNAEAEKFLREAVVGQERALDVNHHDTLLSKHWLGLALYRLERYNEAERYLREAVVGREKTLGPNEESALYSNYWLGRTLFRQQKYDEAEPYLRKSATGLGGAFKVEAEKCLAVIIATQRDSMPSPQNGSGGASPPPRPQKQANKNVISNSSSRNVFREQIERESERRRLEDEEDQRRLLQEYEEVQAQKKLAREAEEKRIIHEYEEDVRRRQEIHKAETMKRLKDEEEEEAQRLRQYYEDHQAKQKLAQQKEEEQRIIRDYEAKRKKAQEEKEEKAEAMRKRKEDEERIIRDYEAKKRQAIEEEQYEAKRKYEAAMKQKQEEEEKLRQEYEAEKKRKEAKKKQEEEEEKQKQLEQQQQQRQQGELEQHTPRVPSPLAEFGSGSGDYIVAPVLDFRSQEAESRSPLAVRTRPRRERLSSSVSSLSNTSGMQQLTSQLDYYFTEDRVQGSPYSDKDVAKIASLLEHLNPRWSRVPRTYIVLRNIDCLDDFDNLIESGFSDYLFPATAKNLFPLPRADQVSKFLAAQHMVLTKSLNLEKGEHCFFDRDETVPLDKQRVLGQGGFGQVDEVVSLVSYERYARKRVLRRMKLEHLQLFVGELETIKRLNHKHVVEFVGSYSDHKYLGLLMRPVAEMDLATYLSRPDISNRLGELRTFFGCLATALSFLHAKKIRHKDIKPQNILVNRGNVLLTDFGLSRDFTDARGSTTVSMANGMTPRYCAPEVAAHEPRNTSSDMWSLGVVFFEMYVVLKGQTRENMDEYLAEHGTRRPFIRTNREGMLELTTTLQSIGRKSDNQVVGWVEGMLKHESHRRQTAEELVNSINGVGSREEYEGGGFCGICCIPHNDDEWSDFSD